MQERWGLSVQAAKVAGFEFTAAGDRLSHHTGVACLRMNTTQKKAKWRDGKTQISESNI